MRRKIRMVFNRMGLDGYIDAIVMEALLLCHHKIEVIKGLNSDDVMGGVFVVFRLDSNKIMFYDVENRLVGVSFNPLPQLGVVEYYEREMFVDDSEAPCLNDRYIRFNDVNSPMPESIARIKELILHNSSENDSDEPIDRPRPVNGILDQIEENSNTANYATFDTENLRDRLNELSEGIGENWSGNIEVTENDNENNHDDEHEVVRENIVSSARRSGRTSGLMDYIRTHQMENPNIFIPSSYRYYERSYSPEDVERVNSLRDFRDTAVEMTSTMYNMVYPDNKRVDGCYKVITYVDGRCVIYIRSSGSICIKITEDGEEKIFVGTRQSLECKLWDKHKYGNGYNWSLLKEDLDERFNLWKIEHNIDINDAYDIEVESIESEKAKSQLVYLQQQYDILRSNSAF